MNEFLQEAPGLYGDFKIREEVIQKIWNDRSFIQKDLKTECGKKLTIINPGKWNRVIEGPDFFDARLILNEKEIRGDVEIHFHAKDWELHGHNTDPNFAKVVLHVTLFPNRAKHFQARSEKNTEIPQLILLPHLFQSVEEYAEELCISKLAGREVDKEETNSKKKLAPEKVEDLAKLRWDEKCQHAQLRLNNDEWEQACHQWFLEILGYPRNKMNMHHLAQRYPISYWRRGVNCQEIYQEFSNWKTKGMRPVSQPINRLTQYASLIERIPEWPSLLAEKVSFPSGNSAKIEKMTRQQINRLNKEWKSQILGDIFGSTKANTLLVDACLPLWSIYHEIDTFGIWYFWPAGNFPDRILKLSKSWELKQSGKSLINGIGQAIIKHFLLDEQEISMPIKSSD